ASFPERLEAALQERLSEPAAAPRPPHADDADVPGLLAKLVPHDPSDLVSVPHDEPQAAVLAAPLLPPFGERRRVPLPVILERLDGGGMKRVRIRLAKVLEQEPLGHRRGGRRRVQIDGHLEEAPHFHVPAATEELDGGRVLGEHPGVHASEAVLARGRLGPLDDRGAEPTPLCALRNDPAERGLGAVLEEPSGCDGPTLLLEQPRISLEIRPVPPSENLGHVDVRRPAAKRLVVGAHERRDGGRVVGRERPDVHAARESSASARPVSERSSTSGWGSGSSPSRLIHTVRSPSSLAGATSWKRLAATCTWPARSAPVRAKNSSQCR